MVDAIPAASGSGVSTVQAAGFVLALVTAVTSAVVFLIRARRKKVMNRAPYLVALERKARFWADPAPILGSVGAGMLRVALPDATDWDSRLKANPRILRALPQRVRQLSIQGGNLEAALRQDVAKFDAAIEGLVISALNEMEPNRLALTVDDFSITLWTLRPSGVPIQAARLSVLQLWVEHKTATEWYNEQLSKLPDWHTAELQFRIHGLPTKKPLSPAEFVARVHHRLDLVPGSSDLREHYQALQRTGADLLTRLDRLIPPIVEKSTDVD